ncbi:MAG TPA: hypothetical protein PK544_17450 [Spirochaetota bacterium]|nr:hypothetical protein [Spirochaetota bacterium]HPJ38370.1 hypothetical protein [Spirochaetota bacterium]HPQ53390.1 hypothetical protein [Spirochaetota bacterium]
MQPDLDNLKNRIRESRDLVDRVINKLPGYSGYVDKGEMYEADRVIRDFLADQISSYKKDVAGLMAGKTKKGELEILDDLDSINTVLERVFKKVKYAEYGTSSSFSKVSVKQEDFDKILEYDWRMIATAEELKPVIDTLKTASADAAESTVEEIKNRIEAFEKAFDDRKHVILEVI